MAEHRFAELLRAVADGKEIEYWNPNNSQWELSKLADLSEWPTLKFRVKPQTININGVECVVPLVYSLDNLSKYHNLQIEIIRPYHTRTDYNRSIQFETEFEAIKVFDALLKPFN